MKILPHEKFLLAIERFGIIRENDKILVALSGGPDSTSCLLNLKAIEKEKKLKIHAIYIDHGVRENIQEEKRFIKNLCKELNIPLHFEKIKISKNKSIEEEAREKRRKIFEKYVKKYKFDRVATGHTLNDIMETLLFRVSRGGFGEKVIGIMPSENFYIRPLVLMTKKENIEFLRNLNVKYRIDITNFDLKITRNYIRHKIIPHFCEVFPEWEKGFLKTYISFFEERIFIQNHIEKIYKENLFMKGKFFFVLKKPAEISDYELKELITFLFQKIKGDKPLSFYQKEEIKKIYVKGKGRTHLSRDTLFEVSTGYMSIFKDIEFKKKIKIKKGVFKWEPFDIKIKVNKPIKGFLRTREEGDYILLSRKKKKMKKVFNEIRMPRFLRKYIPLIAQDKRVLWVWPDIFSDDLKKLENYDKIIEVKDEA